MWVPSVKLDSITIVVLVIAALPWAQPLIKSIELLGVKLELQELKSELADAKGAAASAERKADYLLSAVAPASLVETANDTPAGVAVDGYSRLSDAYEHIRETQPWGPARTQAMTEVVREMIERAPNVQRFDVEQNLRAKRRGERLAAYAFLYARPDFRFLEQLVRSVTRLEDKAFGQYWGLQAISRVLAARKQEIVPRDVTRELLQFAERVPAGTDRDHEVRKILRGFDLEGKSD